MKRNIQAARYLLLHRSQDTIFQIVLQQKSSEQHKEYETIHIYAKSLVDMYTLNISIKNRIIHSDNTCSAKSAFTYLHNYNKRHIE